MIIAVMSAVLPVANCQGEITAVIRVATELSGFGEEKVQYNTLLCK